MFRKNITISVTPETYRQARMWAAARNTNVSRVLQSFLDDLPGLISRRFPLPDSADHTHLLKLAHLSWGRLAREGEPTLKLKHNDPEPEEHPNGAQGNCATVQR